MTANDDSGTRHRILRATYGLIYRAGFARVSLDEIARTAGVTKRTVYYHYDSKDALIAAALDHHAEEALRLILDWGAGDHAAPADLIRSLFSGLRDWAGRPRWHGSGFSRVAWELADLPGHPARDIADRHKAAVRDWLAAEFARLGARDADRLACRVALLMEGAMTLTLVHGDATFIAEAGAAAERLAADHAG